MAEKTILKREIPNRDILTIVKNPVVLPKYVATRYQLKELKFVKTQGHLCLCCDLFFQHVQKGWAMPHRIQEGINKAIMSTKTDEYFYPRSPKFFQLIDARGTAAISVKFFSRSCQRMNKNVYLISSG
jgi:hypothetical protein